MHIHILGICGTFMGGIAVLAKKMGYRVSGSDANVYPPMSTQLTEQGITLIAGYDKDQLLPRPDKIVVGNALSRGNPAVELMLNQGLPYLSGPQWLAEQILKDRWVLAVAGTHGKTTTTSILAWILEYAGLSPGFLIGGVPQNFGISARLGQSPFFVIEADEYDTAFFDKRSKFIHYHPRTLILNNLEYDHADIFPDLTSIQQQFHYLIRTVPGIGQIIVNDTDLNLAETLTRGCWTSVSRFAGQESEWRVGEHALDGSYFDILYQGKKQGTVKWALIGQHNMHNALAAIAAARHVDVSIDTAIQALSDFKNVKRRLEVCGEKRGITVYDDFAHHPTAIATTLAGLRASVGKNGRIVAVLECGSNTMQMGAHQQQLATALHEADRVLLLRPANDWGVANIAKQLTRPCAIYSQVEEIVYALAAECVAGDHILIMSNKNFGGLHQKLLTAL